MPLETDPVCGMKVDLSVTRYHSAYGTKLCHFCSSDCRDEFDHHPETYVLPLSLNDRDLTFSRRFAIFYV